MTSIPPTEATKSPTFPPTAEPEFASNMEQTACISGSAFVIFLLIIVALIYYFRVYKKEKQSLYITNGMILFI